MHEHSTSMDEAVNMLKESVYMLGNVFCCLETFNKHAGNIQKVLVKEF